MTLPHVTLILSLFAEKYKYQRVSHLKFKHYLWRGLAAYRVLPVGQSLQLVKDILKSQKDFKNWKARGTIVHTPLYNFPWYWHSARVFLLTDKVLPPKELGDIFPKLYARLVNGRTMIQEAESSRFQELADKSALHKGIAHRCNACYCSVGKGFWSIILNIIVSLVLI